MTDRDHVIAAVADVVPAVVRERFPLDKYGGVCLIASRVGTETLRYFGVASEPTAVQVLAGNAAWQRWITGDDPTVDSFPADAWNVATGLPGVPLPGGVDMRDRWPDGTAKRGIDGHVVLVIDDPVQPFLLDLAAQQFSRPAKGIVVPPAVAVPWDGHVGGLDLADGAAIVYHLHPDPPRFKHAVDWRRSAPEAGDVIRRVRDLLDSAATSAQQGA